MVLEVGGEEGEVVAGDGAGGRDDVDARDPDEHREARRRRQRKRADDEREVLGVAHRGGTLVLEGPRWARGPERGGAFRHRRAVESGGVGHEREDVAHGRRAVRVRHGEDVLRLALHDDHLGVVPRHLLLDLGRGEEGGARAPWSRARARARVPSGSCRRRDRAGRAAPGARAPRGTTPGSSSHMPGPWTRGE